MQSVYVYLSDVRMDAITVEGREYQSWQMQWVECDVREGTNVVVTSQERQSAEGNQPQSDPKMLFNSQRGD